MLLAFDEDLGFRNPQILRRYLSKEDRLWV